MNFSLHYTCWRELDRPYFGRYIFVKGVRSIVVLLGENDDQIYAEAKISIEKGVFNKTLYIDEKMFQDDDSSERIKNFYETSFCRFVEEKFFAGTFLFGELRAVLLNEAFMKFTKNRKRKWVS